ncbi:MAG TPA: GFA family protein [Steroidobacteraceae bacterium]|nr:GFA family protein [Steroidobacteraceae bacterium]
MMLDPESSTGGCLCGGVRYVVRGALRDVIACHCSQCRRTSGHFVAATSTPLEQFSLTESETLRWYLSSDRAKRGFCSRCGGNLFWQPLDESPARISITAGTLDPPTRLRMSEHIFVADKSDYYNIEDGLPQSPRWPE